MRRAKTNRFSYGIQLYNFSVLSLVLYWLELPRRDVIIKDEIKNLGRGRKNPLPVLNQCDHHIFYSSFFIQYL